MNHRRVLQLFASGISLLTFGGIAINYAKTNTPNYVDATTPGKYVAYLNGAMITGVQAAHATEGWVDIVDIEDNKKLNRVYGDVKILPATPEQIRENKILLEKYRGYRL